MSLAAFCALLAAAALHAGWNALVRRDPDSTASSVAVAAGSAVVGAVLVPLLPPLAARAIPFVIASSILQVLYYWLVARAYRHGELSVVYPIMRGLAPLIVTIAGALFIEPTRPAVFAGVAIVAVGIVVLGADGLRQGRAGIGAAIANAGVIAAYTLLDGLGARGSGAPAAYTAWILVGGGLGTLAWQLGVHGKPLAVLLRGRLALGLAGGLMGFGAYGIALWAMTVAPIGAVAAVRESSVLIATALGALVLHERFGAWRWLAAGLVVAGLAVVKLGGAG